MAKYLERHEGISVSQNLCPEGAGWGGDPVVVRARESLCDAVLDATGQLRGLDEAGVVEPTALLRRGSGGDQLANWPADLHIICCREKPHPGAQLSLFENADGWCYQLLATNTPGATPQFLAARHRPHARVEDNIRAANTPA